MNEMLRVMLKPDKHMHGRMHKQMHKQTHVWKQLAMAANNKGKIRTFQLVTSFNLEAGVKGQKHLEKIPRP